MTFNMTTPTDPPVLMQFHEWVEKYGVTCRPKSHLRWGGDVSRSQAIRARNARKAEAGNQPGYMKYLASNLGKIPCTVETLQHVTYMLPRDEAEQWLSRYGYRKGTLGWVRPEGLDAQPVLPPLNETR